jgi:DNA-binding FadR family transcriptional regulator
MKKTMLLTLHENILRNKVYLEAAATTKDEENLADMRLFSSLSERSKNSVFYEMKDCILRLFLRKATNHASDFPGRQQI